MMRRKKANLPHHDTVHPGMLDRRRQSERPACCRYDGLRLRALRPIAAFDPNHVPIEIGRL
jgi:hypothetical protein